MYHPSQEMAQLSQVPQIENRKPDFPLCFKKSNYVIRLFSNNLVDDDRKYDGI